MGQYFSRGSYQMSMNKFINPKICVPWAALACSATVIQLLTGGTLMVDMIIID